MFFKWGFVNVFSRNPGEFCSKGEYTLLKIENILQIKQSNEAKHQALGDCV